jgi:hypothetical protein
MYSKQESAAIKRKFWTSFGQYMKPVRSVSGETVNWMNYKTGVKHLYFRLDTERSAARVSIEIRMPDFEEREAIFNKLLSVKNIFDSIAGNDWIWEEKITDEDGITISRISKSILANVLVEGDWPVIISFLKPSVIAMDAFWTEVKDLFL